jgi:hypothetical protein
MERRRAESVRLDNELGFPWPKLSWAAAAAAASDMLKKDANESASKSKYFGMWTDGGKEETPSTMCAPE